MCGNHFKLVNDKPAPAFCDHLNRVHASRSEFPPTTFLSTHDRLICSTPGCHRIYHSRFKNMGCQRRVGPRKKCGSSLQLLDLNVIQSTPCSIHHVSPSPQPAIFSSVPLVTYSSPLDAAMEVVVSLSWPNGCTFNEGEAIYSLFNTIMTTHVATVKHVPRSCRQLLGEVLCNKKKMPLAITSGVWLDCSW